MNKPNQTLLFVYNAEAGFLNKLIDFTHKSLKPSTYPCSLCQLTYGTFSAKPEWNDFIKGLDLKVNFLYKDELGSANYELPIILLEDEKKEVSILVDNETLNRIKTLDELIKLIKTQLLYSLK
jgi:hypothetical protein